MKVHRKCRLCLKDGVELRNSHFFPAAAYKIIRAETIREGSENPNPLLVTDLSAIQTSDQYTARLLCERCEQRFHKNGENWVLGHCWRGDAFRLLTLVAGGEAKLSAPEITVYHAAEIPGIDVHAMTYFAASMFWRAGVHNWSGRSIEPAIELGPYEEQLRQYLHGVAEFPRHCKLMVVLPPSKSETTKYVMHPYPTKLHEFFVYTLPFLGIGFSLLVGRSIPDDWHDCDFVRGNGNPIVVHARYQEMFTRDILKLLGGKHPFLRK